MVLTRIVFLCTLVLALFGVTSERSLAQFGLSASDFASYQPEFTFTPSTPQPGQEVTVEISNFVSTLQGASIRWYVQGEELRQFQNNPTARFTAGAVGQQNTVEARLQATNGQSFVVSGTVTAQFIDIIVEPQTHVPDFYTGRALPSSGSQVNVTALINGQPSTDYIYSWRINNELLNGTSLRGQYRTSFTMPQDSRVILKLDVTRTNGQFLGSTSVVIPNTRPFIEFYEVNTLYGVAQNTYDSLFLRGNSATLVAVPYFLDTRVYNRPDVAAWEVNGRAVTTSGNPYEITMERTQNSGSVALSFQVQSVTSLLQGAKNSISVNY